MKQVSVSSRNMKSYTHFSYKLKTQVHFPINGATVIKDQRQIWFC